VIAEFKLLSRKLLNLLIVPSWRHLVGRTANITDSSLTRFNSTVHKGIESAAHRDTEKELKTFGKGCAANSAIPGVVHIITKYAGSASKVQLKVILVVCILTVG